MGDIMLNEAAKIRMTPQSILLAPIPGSLSPSLSLGLG